MNTKYYNPYLEDESLAELTPDDIEDDDARDVVETVEAFIDGLRDWNILEDMTEHGIPFTTFDDEELASAIVEQVTLSLEAELFELIADIVDEEESGE